MATSTRPPFKLDPSWLVRRAAVPTVQARPPLAWTAESMARGLERGTMPRATSTADWLLPMTTPERPTPPPTEPPELPAPELIQRPRPGAGPRTMAEVVTEAPDAYRTPEPWRNLRINETDGAGRLTDAAELRRAAARQWAGVPRSRIPASVLEYLEEPAGTAPRLAAPGTAGPRPLTPPPEVTGDVRGERTMPRPPVTPGSIMDEGLAAEFTRARRRVNPTAADVVLEPVEEAGRGIVRWGGQIGADVGNLTAFAGNITGAESVEEIGRKFAAHFDEMTAEYEPAVASLGEIHNTGDFLAWAGAALGEQLPNIIPVAVAEKMGVTVAGAFARHFVTAARDYLVRRGASVALAEMMVARSVAGMVGKQLPRIGGWVGGLAATTAMEAGDIYGTIDREFAAAGRRPGLREAGITLGYAGAAGLLDKIGFDEIMHGTMGRTLTDRIKAGLLSRLAGLGVSAVTEGATERLQTRLENLAAATAAGRHLTDAEVENEIEAMWRGALGGGVIGGGMRAVEAATAPPTADEIMDRVERIAAGEAVPPVRYQVPAYHGTPHEFDRFDVGRIGSGEGSQSYGWGLYFAGRESVAQWYRDKLTRPRDTVWLANGERVPYSHREHAQIIANIAEGKPVTPEMVEMGISEIESLDRKLSPLEREAERSNFAPFIGKTITSAPAPRGHLYEVNLAPDESDFLDWDKPLSEQGPKVRAALETLRREYRESDGAPGKFYIPDHATGRDIYREIERQVATDDDYNTDITGYGYDAPERASKFLDSIGIPGIKYLDAASRRNIRILSPNESVSGKWVVGEAPNGPNRFFDNEADARRHYERELANQNRNYVVFDDKHVEIARRYQAERSGQRGAGITLEALRAEVPFVEWTDHGDGRFTGRLPNGDALVIETGLDRIEIIEEAFRAEYRRPPTPEELRRGAVAAAHRMNVVTREQLLQFTSGADVASLREEMAHVAERFLTAPERRALRRGGIDNAKRFADAYNEWRRGRAHQDTAVGRILAKIRGIFDRLLGVVGLATRGSVMRGIEGGRSFENAGNGPMLGERYAVGDPLRDSTPPRDPENARLLNVAQSVESVYRDAAEVARAWPRIAVGADSRQVTMKERGAISDLVNHMLTSRNDDGTRSYDRAKAAWFGAVLDTVRTASRVVFDPDNKSHLYVKRYADGEIHFVVVDARGQAVEQGTGMARLVTQFPGVIRGNKAEMIITWERATSNAAGRGQGDPGAVAPASLIPGSQRTPAEKNGSNQGGENQGGPRYAVTPPEPAAGTQPAADPDAIGRMIVRGHIPGTTHITRLMQATQAGGTRGVARELNAMAEESYQKLIFDIIDDLRPLKWYRQKVETAINAAVLPLDDPFIMADLAKSDRIHRVFFDRMTRILNAPGVQGNLATLENLLTAYRVRDYEAAGKSLGITQEMADATIAKYETPELRDARIALYAWQDDALQYAVDRGVISEESAEVWRERNLFYAPMRRLLEPEDLAQLATLPPDPRIGVKARTGGEQQILSPIESMVMNMSKMVQKANENEVALKLLRLDEMLPDKERMLERAPDFKSVPFQLEEIERTMQDVGIALSEDQLKSWAVIFRAKPRAEALNKGYVPIVEDGRLEYYKLHDPQLAGAFASLNEWQPGAITKFLGAFAAALRTGVVLDPGFWTKNIMRDSIGRFIFYGDVPFFAQVADLWAAKKDPKLWEQFREQYGYKLGVYDMSRRTAAQRALDEYGITDRGGALRRIRRRLAGIAVAAQAATDYAEATNRFGIWRRHREQFMQEGLDAANAGAKATHEARDFLNFAQKGNAEWVRNITHVTAFMRAGLNGMEKSARVAAERPLKVAIRTAMLSAASVGLLALIKELGDEYWEEYRHRPEYERHLFWLLPIKDARGRWIRIPKPQEYGMLMALAEVGWRAAREPGYPAAEEAGMVIAQMFGPNLDPQALGLAMEIMTGIDLFTGEPIEPAYLKKVEPADRFTRRTTLTARAVGRVMDWSPKAIDHYTRAVFGNLGKRFMQAADFGISAVTGVEAPTSLPDMLFEMGGIFSKPSTPWSSAEGVRLEQQLEALRQRKASAELNGTRLTSQERRKLNALEAWDEAMSGIRKAMQSDNPERSERARVRGLQKIDRYDARMESIDGVD